MDTHELRLAACQEARVKLMERFDGECRIYIWSGRVPSPPTDKEIEEEANKIYAFLTK